MKIWVLMKGELSEGGNLIGLYTSKAEARPDFEKAIADATRYSKIRDIFQENDEDIEITAGCDWIRLSLEEVKGKLELA